MTGSGCFHYPGGIAPSTVPLSQNGYTVLGKVNGEDCVYRLLEIIPISGSNDLRTAVANAMKKKPMTDALIEVTVDAYMHHWILFAYITTSEATTR